MPLAGLVGGVSGGPLIEYLGRKNTILATSIPFIVSWLLIACAVNIEMIISGRAITGFCVGVASLALPVYLGETIQPEVRGTLGLLPTAFGNIGECTRQTINYFNERYTKKAYFFSQSNQEFYCVSLLEGI